MFFGRPLCRETKGVGSAGGSFLRFLRESKGVPVRSTEWRLLGAWRSGMTNGMSMKYATCLLLVAAGCAGMVGAEPAGELPDPEARLQWFLGDDELHRTLLPVIDRLDADSFAARQAASAELAELPMLPAFVRRLAQTDERPEVRFRLRELAMLRPLEKETDELNKILKRIAEDGVKGTLGSLAGIVQSEVWTPNDAMLEQAARATVTAPDLPLLGELQASPAVTIRRLAAAAYGGLPQDQSGAALHRLLDDPDPSVALLAASELARRGDAACLGAFARLLDAPDFSTRHRSWSALKGLSGKAFGFDPSAAEDARQEGAGRWQKWSRGPDARIVGELPESSVIALFNGRDLTGWDVYETGKPAPDQTTWEVRDDALVSVGKGRGDIRTTAAFENYVLTLQYRMEAPGGDGGVGVMLTKENEKDVAGPRLDGGDYLEVQLLPQRTGDLYLIGKFRAEAQGKPITFSSRRSADVDDPVGQWHTLRLTVQDGDIEVDLNGTVVNRATGGSKGPGKILLRNEGAKIAYKNLVVLPLGP